MVCAQVDSHSEQTKIGRRERIFFSFLPSLTLSFLHMCLVFLDILSYLPASIFLSPLYEFLFSTLFSFSLNDSFATLHWELNSFCRKGSKQEPLM